MPFLASSYIKAKRRIYELKLAFNKLFKRSGHSHDITVNKIKESFSNTYKYNRWGSPESRSGRGSELTWASNMQKALGSIIIEYDIQTIFDTSCGDWNWMKEIRHILPNYLGNDIVSGVIATNTLKFGSDNIKFVCNDMVSEIKKHQKFDLVICRHTLEHLPLSYALEFIKELKERTKYAIITSNPNCENTEMAFDGYMARGVNLEKEPFKNLMGQIISVIPDGPNDEQYVPALFIKF